LPWVSPSTIGFAPSIRQAREAYLSVSEPKEQQDEDQEKHERPVGSARKSGRVPAHSQHLLTKETGLSYDFAGV